MQLIGTVRSTRTFKQEASGSDRDALRAELTAAVPQGFEVVHIAALAEKHGAMTLEVRARSTETMEITTSGDSYAAAREALMGEFDQSDWSLLFVRRAD